MQINNLPFGTTDWHKIVSEKHLGERDTRCGVPNALTIFASGSSNIPLVIWPITGAIKGIFFTASKGSCIPSWKMAAPLF